MITYDLNMEFPDRDLTLTVGSVTLDTGIASTMRRNPNLVIRRDKETGTFFVTTA